MLNRSFQDEERALLCLPCATPAEAMAAGRAVSEQWKGRSIALAREEGPRAGLLSLSAVAGLMAGGSHALDYGVRARGEFHFLRDSRCPAALFFREQPQPALEVYGPGAMPLEEAARRRLSDLCAAGQDALPPRDIPGQWLREKGGREDYFRKLAGMGQGCLEGVCCRFSAPDRQAQALGNQALSVLGVRASGGGCLVLDRLGRLACLRRGEREELDWKRILLLLCQEEVAGRPERRSRHRMLPPWLQDGLMAGILLLSVLDRREQAAPRGAGTPAAEEKELVVGLPILRLSAPQDHT